MSAIRSLMTLAFLAVSGCRLCTHRTEPRIRPPDLELAQVVPGRPRWRNCRLIGRPSAQGLLTGVRLVLCRIALAPASAQPPRARSTARSSPSRSRPPRGQQCRDLWPGTRPRGQPVAPRDRRSVTDISFIGQLLATWATSRPATSSTDGAGRARSPRPRRPAVPPDGAGRRDARCAPTAGPGPTSSRWTARLAPRRGEHIDHLPAIAPAIAHVLPGHPPQEPAIAVSLGAEDAGGAAPPAFVDPGRGDDLPPARPTAPRVCRTEGQQRPGAHSHLVAAQIDALRIAVPSGDAKSGNGRTASRVRRPAAGGRLTRVRIAATQMRRCGRILHPRPGSWTKGAASALQHQFGAADPSAVILSRMAFQPACIDSRLPRVTRQPRVGRCGQVAAQQRCDGLIRALQQAAADGDARQRRHHRFRRPT